MTPVDRLDRAERPRPLRARGSLPPLENGDRLTRVEFEKRYEAMPENVKAELIDGVVYMSSPTKAEHGDPVALVDAWLVTYASKTSGTRASSNATLRLDEESEPQPDALLRLVPEAGGRSRVDDEGYLQGGVELAVEVAASSASYDLHQKKAVYQRHACVEYLVVVVRSREVIWFAREESGYLPLVPDKRGVIRSRVFLGLWLDTRALLAGDGRKLLATLERGLASKAHAGFARELAKRLARGRRGSL